MPRNPAWRDLADRLMVALKPIAVEAAADLDRAKKHRRHVREHPR